LLVTPFDYSIRAKKKRDRDVLDAACDLLASNPVITMNDLARRVGTGPTNLRRVLGPTLAGYARHKPRVGARVRKKSRAWTNKQLLEALQESSRFLGGDVREAKYRDLAARPGSHAPSSQTIIRRFGTWNTALEAAGILQIEPSREYDKWTSARCAKAVAEFILETTSTSVSKYQDWAFERDAYRSPDTIEKVLLWHEVVNLALGLMGEPDSRARFIELIDEARLERVRGMSASQQNPPMVHAS